MGFDKVKYAEDIIVDQYGFYAKVGAKNKSLIKYGANPSMSTGVREMVWGYGGTEILALDNDIDTVSSSNINDDQVIIVEGHILNDNNDLEFRIQTVALNGQNKVTLSIPLYRCTRAYNNTSFTLEGTVFFYEDGAISAGVPSDPTSVHLTIDPLDNQSLKCATSTSHEDFWIVTQLAVGVLRQQSASVDFSFQLSERGNVFRTLYPISANSNGGKSLITFDQPIIVPPNSDVRMVATSSANGVAVNAALHGYLALIQR